MKVFISILALLSLIVGTAYAQDNPPPAGHEGSPGGGPRAACREDVHTFCSDVQPGGGRIINCLQDHYKEVSDNCYAALQKLNDRRAGNGNQNQGDAPPPPPKDGGD